MRCEPAHYFTVAKARAWRSAIDVDPAYQRGGDAWTLAQRRRFIDSLLNGYDVPKLYLHDLRGRHPTKVYAVVDGKQRLTAIWSFLADGFALSEDFRIETQPPDASDGQGMSPAGALRFSGLAPDWQARLLGTYLSVVLIRDADEADIDELFARLNDGAPLTAAEARNALAGEMSALVREVAALPVLRTLLSFEDRRGSHRDVAAALLALEDAEQRDVPADADLGPSGLDAFVRARGEIGAAARAVLRDGVERGLLDAAARLDPDDPRLATAPSAIEALRLVRARPAGATRSG